MKTQIYATPAVKGLGTLITVDWRKYTGLVFLYKLQYIVGFRLVETAISTNPNPTIYRNL